MLAERPANSGLVHNHAITVEIAECIHCHLEEWRFVWTTEELLAICDVFAKAKHNLLALGSPPQWPENHTLGHHKFTDKRMHYDRLGIELIQAGNEFSSDNVHIHNKSLRTHMTAMDFYEYSDAINEAQIELCSFLRSTINLRADNILYHPVVDKHLSVLDKYKASGERVSASEVGELEYKVRWYTRHPRGIATTEADLQRPSGPTQLPSPCSGEIPEDLDVRYTCALYESILAYGYAQGPYYNKFLPVYKMPKGLYLKGSHRAAALMAAGYSEIQAFVSDPPTGWHGSGE